MTREEAIEFGNMWLQISEDCKNSSTYAFFQMAIKALSQEPSDVLSKIRAEIESKEMIETTSEREFYNMALNDVLQIIDKYRAESEE